MVENEGLVGTLLFNLLREVGAHEVLVLVVLPVCEQTLHEPVEVFEETDHVRDQTSLLFSHHLVNGALIGPVLVLGGKVGTLLLSLLFQKRFQFFVERDSGPLFVLEVDT